MPHPQTRGRTVIASLALLGLAMATPRLAAQDSTVAVIDAAAPPPVTMAPLEAFARSLLVPGWAQAKLDRKLTAALFIAWEGVTLGMTLKASHELSVLERTSSSRVDAKRAERQDWLVLLVFNHLFAGLEAFVSSQLADFPADVRVRTTPGTLGGQVSTPLRLP